MLNNNIGQLQFNETVTHFPQFDKRHDAEFSTPQQSDMASHFITASGDKIYNCSEFHMSFGQSGDLKRHMVTHSKENTYACVQCRWILM